MEPAFHYVVNVKLIKSKADAIDSSKIFGNDNPIIAREEAFDHYQSWLDVLLGGQRIISDKQARMELISFIDPGTGTKVKIGEAEIEINDSFGNGIGVFLVIDNPIREGEKIGEQVIIHGIGSIASSDSAQSLMDGLNLEYEYYRHYGYDTKNHKQTIDFFDYDAGETEANEILGTPFDWTGYDIPQEAERTKQVKGRTLTLGELINEGEGNQVEFKPALLYNFLTDKAGIGIKGIIAKTICAFLNSNGGYLLIGLDDNGEVRGLDRDFSLSNGKNPKDFFQNEFDQMIEHFLSFSVKSNIFGKFAEEKGKDIFVVRIDPSRNRAIFLKGQSKKEFWVRGNAGNRQITDMEELANYCIDRWAKGSDNT